MTQNNNQPGTEFQVLLIPVTPFQQNCSLIWDPENLRGALVDPGGDMDRIIKAVTDKGVTIEKIFVTHGHMDHCGAAGQASAHFNAPIEGPHLEDLFWIEAIEDSARQYGLSGAQTFNPDRWLDEGDVVDFAGHKLKVLHCPGHTPGSVVFYSREGRLAFVGDVLFHGSIGRTDFPKGDYQQLISSITTKLWPLGDDVTFVSGHGPVSNFGQERQSNAFVADQVLAQQINPGQ